MKKTFAEAYIELLQEYNYKLEEMSKPLKDIKLNEIQCYEKKMLEHLCKLYFYNDLRSGDINGWKDEIHNFISTVSLIKGKNKYPTETQLNNWTINQFSDVLETRIKAKIEDLIYDGFPRKSNYNIDGAYNFIIDYYRFLNKTLSQKGAITKGEVSTELDRLLKLYGGK